MRLTFDPLIAKKIRSKVIGHMKVKKNKNHFPAKI